MVWQKKMIEWETIGPNNAYVEKRVLAVGLTVCIIERKGFSFEKATAAFTLSSSRRTMMKIDDYNDQEGADSSHLILLVDG